MDKLRLIDLFVRVVERGSLTAAADSASVSVPTVVRSLARLERSVGVRLIERTTRRHRVTEEGRDYYLRCRQLLADLAAADDAVAARRSEPMGRISVTASIPFGRRYVAPLLAEFVTAHPGTRVELQLTDRVVDLLEEGVDLAVRLGRLPDSGLVSAPIGVTRVVTCASESYLGRRGVPGQPVELMNHDCVLLLGSPSARTWEFAGTGRSASVTVSGRLAVNHLESVLDACIRGAGIGRFLEYQVRDSIHRGDLRAILRRFEPPPIPIQLVYPSARLLSARIRSLRDWLLPRLRAMVDGRTHLSHAE